MKKRLVRFISFLVLALVLLVVYLGVRTLTDPVRQQDVALLPLPVQDEGSIDRFSEAIRIRTISRGGGLAPDTAQFELLHQHIQNSYPLVDSLLTREKVADLSLLYTWQGSNPDVKPIVLIGHQDVVPVEDSTAWEQPPFAGIVADGYIWGRGAMDDKITVFSILEAVERLLAEGFQPERTLYLGFGHDEETTSQGAIAIAGLLASRGIEAEFVVDEGGLVTRGIVPGIDQPVAVVSIAEKGYMSVTLSVELEEGGHSSMPPPEPSTQILARAILNIREQQPKARVSFPMEEFFNFVGPEASFPFNVIFANQYLLSGLLTKVISDAGPSGNASMRTTVAPTMIQAGIKDNILPTKAQATVNLRLLPGDSSESILEHLRAVIDDPRVSVALLDPDRVVEPSVVSSTEGFGFKAIEYSLKQVFDSTVVAPNLSVSYTDVRNYDVVSGDLYRFLPIQATSEDLTRIHGANERVSLEDWNRAIFYYEQLIRNGSRETWEPAP